MSAATTSRSLDETCEGIGPVNALTSAEIPRAAALTSGLAAATEEAALAARRRHPWLSGAAATLAAPLPEESALQASLRRAADLEDAHLFSYLPSTDGELEEHIALAAVDAGALGLAPQTPRFAAAAATGGLALLRSSRYHQEVADICDDVALATGGPVNAAIVSGEISATGRLLSSFDLAVLIAIERSCTVNHPDEGPIRIEPGNLVHLRPGSSLETSGQGAAVVLYGQLPTVDDIWELAVRKAAHWPRLRADLPYDLDQPVVAYDQEEPVDPVTLLLEEFDDLLSDETFFDALAAHRARICPAPRPAGAWPTPSGPEAWMHRRVVGRFPGGISHLDSPSADHVWLVFAGCAVRVEHHLVDLMTRLVVPTDVTASEFTLDCPHQDPYCAARAIEVLHSLSVVSLSEPST